MKKENQSCNFEGEDYCESEPEYGPRMWRYGFYYINSDITKETFLPFIDDILCKFQNSKWDKKITVFINSSGGDFDATSAFLDFIKLLGINMRTIGLSSVASAALLLLMSGKERSCSKSCILMSHRFAAEVGYLSHGDALDLTDDWNKIYDKFIDIYKRGSKYNSKKTIEKELLPAKRTVMLTGPEALKHGLVDKLF